MEEPRAGHRLDEAYRVFLSVELQISDIPLHHEDNSYEEDKNWHQEDGLDDHHDNVHCPLQVNGMIYDTDHGHNPAPCYDIDVCLDYCCCDDDDNMNLVHGGYGWEIERNDDDDSQENGSR